MHGRGGPPDEGIDTVNQQQNNGSATAPLPGAIDASPQHVEAGTVPLGTMNVNREGDPQIPAEAPPAEGAGAGASTGPLADAPHPVPGKADTRGHTRDLVAERKQLESHVDGIRDEVAGWWAKVEKFEGVVAADVKSALLRFERELAGLLHIQFGRSAPPPSTITPSASATPGTPGRS